MSVIDTTQPVSVDRFIAGVLRRAHQTAEAAGAPEEERVILRLAHVFAEDLAKTDARFDRPAFIAAITEHVS
jgi:hypothetical protein